MERIKYSDNWNRPTKIVYTVVEYNTCTSIALNSYLFLFTRRTGDEVGSGSVVALLTGYQDYLHDNNIEQRLVSDGGGLSGVTSSILRLGKSEFRDYISRHVIAAYLSSNSSLTIAGRVDLGATGLFNLQSLHSSAISLSAIDNALFRSVLDTECTCTR